MKTRLLSTARLSLPLATALAALLAAPVSHATTINWDGDTSTDWATGDNWAGGTAPVDDLTTDIANFDLATYGGDPVFAPTAGTRSINGITIGATNGAMTLTTTNLSVGGSGISIAEGAGALTISGGLTLGAAQSWIKNSTNAFTVSASVDNGGFLLTVDGTGGTSISGNISGTGGLAKQSAAGLTLTGTNTYSGATTFSAGRLILNSTGALSPNTAVTVSGSGQLFFQPNTVNQTYNNAMTLSGVGFAETSGTQIGAIRFENGVTLGGTMTLPADARVGTIGTRSATISGQVTGSGGLEFHGVKSANNQTSIFTLSNTGNDYAGTTTISSKNFDATNRTGAINTLKLGAAGVIPDGVGKGIVAFTGTSSSHTNILDLNGFAETVNGLSSTGAAAATITNTAAGTAVLTVGAADTTSSFSGTITEAGSGAILALSKTGTGTLTLGGANTYTGATTVNAGTFVLADDAQLKFVLGATSGANNAISGAGTVTLNGDFVIDTTAADALETGTWTLENVSTLTGPYGATFSVVGFTDAGGNKWTKPNGLTKIYTFDETTGTLTLGAAAGDPFADWASSKGLDGNPGKEAGFDDDPDGDGFANGLEWILGGEPLDGQSGSLVTTTASAAGGLTLAFTRDEDSIGEATLTVEYNTDLGAVWNNATIGTTSSGPDANGVTVTINTGTTPDGVSVNIPASNAPAGKLFGRLKATQP